MEVHRNLRTPKAQSNRMRMVRIVGDGTPENTRLLDRSGEPLEELVTSYSVQGDGNGCARGVFIFTEIDPETGNFVMDEDSGTQSWPMSLALTLIPQTMPMYSIISYPSKPSAEVNRTRPSVISGRVPLCNPSRLSIVCLRGS